jgi:hypothetical protein
MRRTDSSFPVPYGPSGNPGDDITSVHVFRDDGVRANHRPIAHAQTAQHHRTRSHDDSITQNWIAVIARFAVRIALAESDVLENGAVSSHHYPGSNDDPLRVAHHQSRPHPAPRQELGARQTEIGQRD